MTAATSGDHRSGSNLSHVSHTLGNMFGDHGGVRELATVMGDVMAALTVTPDVPARRFVTSRSAIRYRSGSRQ